MDENIVIVRGLPTTCNPVKVKMKFQAECKVTIKDIKLDGNAAKIQLANEEDCRIFQRNLPKSMIFGSETHTLTLKEPEQPSGSSSSEDTSPDNTNLPELNFDKIYTWPDLVKLVQCSTGILAQPKDTTTSPQDIWDYFQDNKQSCGGTLKAVFAMADGIFLSFEDEQVVDKVWNFRPHRIKGKSIFVYRKDCPSSHKNKVVVKVTDGKMTQNEVKEELQSCSPKSIAPKGARMSGGGVILVNYDHKLLDEKDLAGTLQEFKNRHPSDLALLMLKADCLQIQSFPRDVTEQELRTVFENKSLTNGGCVTAISHLEKSLLVHFSCYSDAYAVLEKCKDEVLLLFGSRMKISLYYSILFSRNANQESSDQMKDYYKIWLEHEGQTAQTEHDSPQETLDYQVGIEEELLHFLSGNENAISILNSKLGDIGSGKISKNGIKISLKESRDENRKTAQLVIQQFLKNYTTKTVGVNDDITRKLIEKRMENKGKEPDVCIRWADSQKKKVVITGLIIQVDLLLSSVIPKENFVTLKFDREKLRWLMEMGTFVTLKHMYPAISGMTLNGVKFTGTKEEIGKAEQAVKEKLKDINCVRFISDKKRHVEFLQEAQQNTKIQNNVFDMMKRGGIDAILTVDTGYPYIVGPADRIDAAVSRLNAALTVNDSHAIDMTTVDRTASPEWKFAEELESEGKIMLKTTTENKLCIIGFREYVKQAVEKLSESIKKEFSEFIQIDHSVAKYIHNFVDEFKNFCIQSSVSCTVFDAGINLRGRKNKVTEAKTILERWKYKVSRSASTVEKFGAIEFLNSQDGKDLIAGIESKYQLIVAFSSKIPSKSSSIHHGAPSGQRKPLQDDKGSIHIVPFTISIRQGDLTDERSDVIVNSISSNFKLSTSKLSHDIAKKGGTSIQEQLKKQSSSPIRVTGGGNLKCRFIIHAYFSGDLRKIGDVLIDVLREADKRSVSSISLPVIGAGLAQHSNHEIASMMVATFCKVGEGSLSPPPKNLRKIGIVILDKTKLPIFRDAFLQANQGSRRTTSASSLSRVPYMDRSLKPLTIGSLTVSVRQGDITEEINDAIVNSTGSNFNLDRGQVSMAILRKGGQKIQSDVHKQWSNSIRVTSGGRLNCSKIIHTVAPQYLSEIGTCVEEVLKTAEDEKCFSLSVPAIGTGNLQLPLSQAARKMLMAVRDFVASGQRIKYLKKVDFVIYDTAQYQEFHDAFFTTTPIQAQSDTRGQPTKGVVDIAAYSLTKSTAEKALMDMKSEIEQTLSCVIRDELINQLTPQDEANFRSYEIEYDVKIVRSRGQISIDGPDKRKVMKARDAVAGMLRGLAQTDFVWEYKDPVHETVWHLFGDALCRDLEICHKKYLSDPYGHKLGFIGDSRLSVNFSTMILEPSTEIRRTVRQSGPASGHSSKRHSFGNSNGKEFQSGNRSGGRGGFSSMV